MIIYQSANRDYHSGMKRPDIRLSNARALAEQVGGDAEFARRMGMSDSQVNQIIGKNPVRGIGNKIAERIEKEFGLAPGDLDKETSITVVNLLDNAPPLNAEGLLEVMRQAADDGVLTTRLIRIFSDVIELAYDGINVKTGNKHAGNQTGRGSVANPHDAERQIADLSSSGVENARTKNRQHGGGSS